MKTQRRFAVLAASAALSSAVFLGAAAPGFALQVERGGDGGDGGHRVEQLQRKDVGSYVKVCGGSEFYINGQRKSGQVSLHGAETLGPDLTFTLGLTPNRTVTILADNPIYDAAHIEIDGKTYYELTETDAAGMKIKVTFWNHEMDGKKYKGWFLDVRPSNWLHEYVHHTGEHDGVKGIVRNHTGAPMTLKMGAWDGRNFRLPAGNQMLFFDSHPFENFRGMKMEMFKGDEPSPTSWLGTTYLGDFWDHRKPVSEVYLRDKPRAYEWYDENQTREFTVDSSGLIMKIKLFPKGDKLKTQHEQGPTSDWAYFVVTISKAE